MGYKSIRIKNEIQDASFVKDFRMQGKFITFILINDNVKTAGYVQDEEHSEILNLTDTTLEIDDIVVINFEV